MLPDENVLLGRLQENSDVSHPSFIPNMEDFFLSRVDKNPIEKFNILSGILSKKIERKIKDEKKTYMKAQTRYRRWEENLGKNCNTENINFTPQEEFKDILHAISQSKQEFTKKKRMSKVSKALTNYHKNARRTGGRSRIPAILDPDTQQLTYDDARIAAIFTHHHQNKTDDVSVDEAAEPELHSPMMHEVADKYGINLQEVFPPQHDDSEEDWERSEFSPYRARPSHQSSKWEQKMDIAMGGTPEGAPSFLLREKVKKTAALLLVSPNRKTFSCSQFSNEKFLFLLSQFGEQRTKIQKKIHGNFLQQIQKNAKKFPNRYKKIK